MSRPLEGIDHIVVLMMENRSFDHMLGYLSLPASMGGAERTDVDGLKGNESNPHQGKRVTVRRLTHTVFPHDPPHDWKSVKSQIEPQGPNGPLMDGFVDDYATVKGVTDPGEVMGYYTGTELPTLDFFARHYCVCDRWFSSFPGATIPNRLFSLAGTSRRVDSAILSPFVLPSVFQALGAQGVSWEVYFEGIIPALRLFSGHGPQDDPHLHGLNFLLKRRKDLPLPAASWIDPHFLSHKDDDHPPADLARGQVLMKRIFDALRARTEWPRTLLIVTYDEHGGFYDHVVPPGFGGTPKIPDDSPDPDLPEGYDPFRRLGPRVPALLISPAIKRAACHDVLDHSAIVRTLIEQFCPDPASALREMPQRVREWARPFSSDLFQASPPLESASPSAAPRARLRTARGGSRRIPKPTPRPKVTPRSLDELEESIKRVLGQLGKGSAGRAKARRRKARPVTSLQKELRAFLQLLNRRGIVRSSQLPASWRKRRARRVR